MKIGLMSYEIESARTVEELFQKVHAYGVEQTQFAFHPFCEKEEGMDATMSKMAPSLSDEMIEEVAYQSRINHVEISMMTGFWNMISKDVADRDEGLLRLERLCQASNACGCDVINLCTGSKGDYMWHRVPENNTVKAWLDICNTMEQALKIADHYKIYLGVEVEASNVINTAEKARKLIDEMGSPWLKIVLDGANVFWPGECKFKNATRILKEAMDILGPDIIGVHGKDMKESDGIDFTYCGNGIVDFDYMFHRLKALGYDRGILLHGAHAEEEIAPSIENCRRLMAKAGI